MVFVSQGGVKETRSNSCHRQCEITQFEPEFFHRIFVAENQPGQSQDEVGNRRYCIEEFCEIIAKGVIALTIICDAGGLTPIAGSHVVWHTLLDIQEEEQDSEVD